MKKIQWLVVVGWFLLAAYVMYRCFTSVDPVRYDVIFAAWLGGILSLACYEIVRHRLT